jgi:hypothetical protein
MSTYTTADLQTTLVLVGGVMMLAQALRNFIDREKNRQAGVATLALVNVILGVLLVYFWMSVLAPKMKSAGGNFNFR